MAQTTRRSFMQSMAAATAAGAVVASGTSALKARAESPNGKLQHACIGVGGMGSNDFKQFLLHSNTDVVALCDVDEQRLSAALEEAKKHGKQPRTYIDWRELLEKEEGKIDSVNVTVPDHMHCAIAIAAIHKGKHVYCQKPMCHDVAEVRALTIAAKKAGVITQLGTQLASGYGDRTAVHWMREGVIGKVKRIVLCANRPGAIERYRLEGPRPEKGDTPPAYLNWDLWLGTAPERDFSPKIYHPAIWRAWQDFGTGWSGDIGCHVFDAVWKGLDLQPPKFVIADVQESWKNDPARRRDTWPQSDHITWIFPGNKMTERELLPIEWFDGLMFPHADVQALSPIKPYPGEAAMVIGTEGTILLPLSKMPILLPHAKFRDHSGPDLEPRNHYHHFVDACLGKAKNESFFARTGPMTEAILLGTVAIRTPGVMLQWDHDRMAIPNYPEAEKFLKRDYRDGWAVETT